MLDELRDLYQEVILDHGRNPRNFRHPDQMTCFAHGNNPMCGDQLTVFLEVDDEGVIRDAAFQGRGCAISTASASLMTEMVVGKSVDQARALFEAFHRLCTSEEEVVAPEGLEDELDKLQVLSGVRQFPVRVKCATLAWHTMDAAVKGKDEVTTEEAL
jgi:nitrogen fixation NifU-like protein